MDIQVFTQNSIKITGQSGIVIYIDPFEIKGEPQDADYILWTHEHYDHLSSDDVAKVRKAGTKYVFPKTMKNSVKELIADDGKAYEVEPNTVQEIDGLKLQVVPAYNNLKPFHPKKNQWVGYLLDLDGQKVYIAGDTDVTPDNKKVTCDIALVPVGGTYTMNAKEAAGLINIIKPSVAIPTHYGTIVGKGSDADDFARLVEDGIEVRIIKQY